MAAKILVIEGKRAERASFVGGLAKKGFQVVSVPSGNAALSRLNKRFLIWWLLTPIQCEPAENGSVNH